MLRESSIRMPRKFCCGTAAFRISDGPKQAEQQKRDDPEAEDHQREPVAAPAFDRDAAVGHQRGTGERRKDDDGRHHRARRGERELALLEDEPRIFEEEVEH